MTHMQISTLLTQYIGRLGLKPADRNQGEPTALIMAEGNHLPTLNRATQVTRPTHTQAMRNAISQSR